MNLKVSILFLLLGANTIFAQTQEDVEDAIWKNSKKTVTIPEKWKDESAVILYKDINYSYHKFGKSVTYRYSIRKRIKLQDKNAVEEFSEFSFAKKFRARGGKRGKIFFGVKIVKPSGKTTVIDLEKHAVKVDGDYKLAIPDLEIGDVIDYYYYAKEPFVVQYSYAFPAVEKTLSEEYPIVNYNLILDTENDFYISFKSLNGAPKLKEIDLDKRAKRKYILKANNLEKSKYPRWFYPMREMQAFKMQVLFLRKREGLETVNVFAPKSSRELKDKVTSEDVLRMVSSWLKTIKYELPKNKKNKPKIKPKNLEDIAKNYNKAIDFQEVKLAAKAHIHSVEDNPYYAGYYFDGKMGIHKLPRRYDLFLSKIPYELLVTTAIYNGKIEDELLVDNMQLMIRTLTDPPLYIGLKNSTYEPFSYLSPSLEGTTVYVLSSSENNSVFDEIRKDKLPVSKYEDNETISTITINPSENLDGFNIKLNTKAKGHSKIDLQKWKIIPSDIAAAYPEKYKEHNFESYIQKYRYYTKNKKKRKIEEFKAYLKKYEKNYIEGLKSVMERGYDITIENYKPKVIKLAMETDLNDFFEYEESFSFKNKHIKKIGKNYLVAIGKFYGKQAEITDEYKKRDADIYFEYAEKITDKIIFNIPEGYTVSGIEKLNKNVDNTSGSFISKARIEGNQLIIDVNKSYKFHYYPKEKWDEIREFIDEANQFTNEKILLKKK